MTRAGEPLTIVITGTDTGVGKTVVGAGLARALSRNHRVVAVKPIESGCQSNVDEDGVQLARATGQTEPTAALLCLVEPLAPPLAADAQDVVIDLRELLRQTRRLGAGAEVLLVEAAGGVLSPLTWDETAIDVACELDAAVLLVARNNLGVINHTRLALGVLEESGLTVLGVVLNTVDADGSTRTNHASLVRFVPGVRVVSLGHVTSGDQAAAELVDVVSWVTERLAR